MKMNKKLLISLCALLALLVVGGAVTLALMTKTSNAVTNTFTAGELTCEVDEDITSTPGVKKAVSLKNTGTVDAFLRACVVVNWVDADGNVAAVAPVEGTDYTLTTPTTFGWIKDGDIYYTKEAVKAGTKSPVLISSIAPVEGKAPDGCVLSVEILGSAIQSEPETAAEEAWGVTVSDGVVSK